MAHKAKKTKKLSNVKLDKMIARAQKVLDKAQAALDGGLLTEVEVVEAHKTIAAMTEKIAKLVARKT